MRAIRFVVSLPWTLKRLGQQSCAVSEGDYWLSCANSSIRDSDEMVFIDPSGTRTKESNIYASIWAWKP